MAHAVYIDAKLSNPSQCIRLMKICSSQSKALLECSLEAFDLDKLPPFNALSYTWGDPLTRPPEYVPSEEWTYANHSVFCNSKNFAVHRNLYEALQTLAEVGYISEYLWIDAICINQVDDIERSAQVTLMSKIYLTAEQVVVWLGPEDDDLTSYMSIHETFWEPLKLRIRDKGDVDASSLGPEDYLQGKLGISMPPATLWMAYCRFLQRGWFNRTWILQEAVMAKHLVVYCGLVRLKWSDIASLESHITSAAWNIFLSEHNRRNQIWVRLNRSIHTIQTFSQLCGIGRANIDSERLEAYSENGQITQAGILLEALYRSQPCSASDSRDKIYGVFGIVDRFMGEEFDPEVIKPDYRLSTVQVYTSVTAYLLKTQKLPTVLSLVTHIKDIRLESELPSWCPDFSSQELENIQIKLGYWNSGSRTPYKATIGIRSTAPARTIEGSVLRVSALIITCSSVVLQPTTTTLDLSQLREILQLCASLPPTYVNGQDRIEALWRTLLGDFNAASTPTQCPAASSLGEQFTAWLIVTVWRHKDEDPQLFSENCALIQELLSSAPKWSTQVDTSRITDYDYMSSNSGAILERCRGYAAADIFSHRRRLSRLGNNMMGLLPPISQVGDQIILLENAAVPYVARRIPGSERYQFIGECYVHGIMQGELIDQDLEFSPITLQ